METSYPCPIWTEAHRVKISDLVTGTRFRCISGHVWTASTWFKEQRHARYADRDDGHRDTFAANAEVVLLDR
jgi:hypothetical protein